MPTRSRLIKHPGNVWPALALDRVSFFDGWRLESNASCGVLKRQCYPMFCPGLATKTWVGSRRHALESLDRCAQRKGHTFREKNKPIHVGLLDPQVIGQRLLGSAMCRDQWFVHIRVFGGPSPSFCFAASKPSMKATRRWLTSPLGHRLDDIPRLSPA